MSYDLEASKARFDAYCKVEDRVFIGAVGTFALAAAVVGAVSIWPSIDGGGEYAVLLVMALLCGIMGGLVGLAAGAGLSSLLEIHYDRQFGLPEKVQSELRKVEDRYTAIMALNPSSTVVEELVLRRNEYEATVDELLQIRRALPGQNLRETPAYKWIEAFSSSLKTLKGEMTDAKLESYSVPRAAPDLAASLTAVAEERQMVRNIIEASGNDAIDYLLNLTPTERVTA